jgi:regulator of protease activity HflC (stomatin/prohibitin superfamily)
MKKNQQGFIGIAASVIGTILLILAFVVIAKSYYIAPGNVGILVYKGGQNAKGVSDKPLTPGWGFRKLFTEDVFEYPTYLQTAIWVKASNEGSNNDDSVTANSKEGVSINIDVSASYTLDANKVPDIYVKYRATIGDIQKTYLRQSVRQSVQDTFGNYSVEEIYGPKKQEIASKILASLTDGVGEDGFNFSQFTINEVRLPENIMGSINEKIKAGQDLKRIKIEADQKVAEAKGNAEARLANAKAEAEAIKIQAAAIQSQGGADYVQLKAIEKWNGSLPAQMIPGAAVPFLNLTK